MPFVIDELRASLSDKGYQKPSHYTATIIPPPALNSNIFSELPVRINSTNLPGISLALDEIKHKGYGLGEKRPNGMQYDDIAFTIIADGNGEVYKGLKKWFDLISPTDIEDVGADEVEYYNYPNTYYGGLEINLYDIAGNKHSTFTFVQPFPSMLGAVQVSWEIQDSLVLIPVSFTYRSFKMNSTYSGYTNTI